MNNFSNSSVAKAIATWSAMGIASGLCVPAAAADADSGQASGGVTLGEVVVTAQRREENLQSVPIAVNIVSGDDLKLRGVDNIMALSASVPNLQLAGATWQAVYLRGVGSNSASPNNEPSVATYIDGVYNPSSTGLLGFPFNNVERIEVLKGPQGTLFGRNATGGIIQVITPDPKQDFSGKVNLNYGNYETVNATGYLTGGLSDSVAADVAVFYEDQGKGWGHDISDGTETYVHENVAARSKWLLTPAESTEIRVALDYAKFSHDGYSHQMLPGSFAAGGPITFPGKYNAADDAPAYYDTEQYGASLKIDQDFGALHGVSISSYRNVEVGSQVDGDITPTPGIVIAGSHESNYITQEFQLSNADPDRIQWLVGAFYFNSDVDYAQLRTGPRVAPGGYSRTPSTQELESISGFAQATAEIVTDTKLTLGLRYTDETLEMSGHRVNSAGQVYFGPVSDEVDYNPWTWRIALDHQFGPDMLGYVSYNHGFKSGGFNLSNPGDAAFLPEELDAYEVGLKSELLNNRLRLNLAAFYYEYEDIQISTSQGATVGGQLFTNAGAAENYGLDAGLDFAATENLMLSAGVGLLSAKYTEYLGATSRGPNGQAISIPDAKGTDLPQSPHFTGYVSGTYKVPTSVGDFMGSVNFSHTGESLVSPYVVPKRPSVNLLTASVEWWSASAFGVRLWGRNLTNEYYPTNLLASSTGWYQAMAAPRTYGLTLMKEF